MAEPVIPHPPAIAVPTSLGRPFPIRRVYCVGRNDAEHAREMGGNPEREAPFFFSKPAGAVLPSGLPEGGTMPYPPATSALEHEIELVVALHIGGTEIATETTRRDQQAAAKQAGRPQDMAKGFNHSAPIGLLVPARDVASPQRGAIMLTVNGVARQQGDLIYSGTPSGMGPMLPGGLLEGEIVGDGGLRTRIV